MPTFEQVAEFILSADEATMKKVTSAVQFRQVQLTQRTKWELVEGDTVKFTSAKKRSPFTYTGKLVSKRQTRAVVLIQSPAWGKYAVGTRVTVPFAMLSKA